MAAAEIKLNWSNFERALARRILDGHIERLARQDMAGIARQLGCSVADAQAADRGPAFRRRDRLVQSDLLAAAQRAAEQPLEGRRGQEQFLPGLRPEDDFLPRLQEMRDPDGGGRELALGFSRGAWCLCQLYAFSSVVSVSSGKTGSVI